MKLQVTANWRELIHPRERAMERWVTRRLGAIVHERRVRQIALKLFDLTLPLHRLKGPDRRLLALAAIAHDVGRCIDDDSHPRQGAKLLSRAAHLPVSRRQRRALIYCTRHHRGRVPELGADKVLHQDDDKETVRILLALLRAADSLDSRPIESPRLVFATRGRHLCITCYLDDDTSRARKVYGRRKKFRLLEELLECKVELKIVQAETLQMVA